MKVQKKISLEHNRKLIGAILKVLINRKEGEYFIGRTEYDSPEVDNEVYIPVIHENNAASVPRTDANSGVYLRTGDFVDVKITAAKEYDLEAVLSEV